MARDYRHGHAHQKKQGFQRKSQQQNSATEKRSLSTVWGAGFLVSALLLVGFFVAQHFASKGVKSGESNDQSIFQAAKQIQQQTVDKVEQVSKQLQPPQPVVVEAIPAPQESSEEQQPPQQYSFYEGLGKTEVLVDAEPLSVQLKQPYFIQAGTFGSEKVAKREQQRLAKMGQTLQLSVLKKPNRTYYRLRVGPFTDRLVMNKRRNELRQLGVDTLLVRAPKRKP